MVDFFGNVQGVEVGGGAGFNETEWEEGMRWLARAFREKEDQEGEAGIDGDMKATGISNGSRVQATGRTRPSQISKVARVQEGTQWTQKLTGTAVLLGLVALWTGSSMLGG